MKPVINKPLGNVVYGHICCFGKCPSVDNTLVSYPPFRALKKDVVATLELFGNVIGIENSDPSGLGQPLPAHHQQVSPRNGQY